MKTKTFHCTAGMRLLIHRKFGLLMEEIHTSIAIRNLFWSHL